MSEFGFCNCGCGQETSISKRNYKRRGILKDAPYPFMRGHTNTTKGGPARPKGHRWCFSCRNILPEAEFYAEKRGGSRCKACSVKRSAKIYRENRELILIESRNYYIKRKYNLTPLAYKNLCKLQNNTCAICNKKDSIGLAVDHSHSTGEIRGLLCTTCNLGLGNFFDNASLLEHASIYLKTSGTGLFVP